MHRRRRLLIGMAISLVFLYLTVRNLRPGELWALFREANYIYLVPALAVLVAINWTRAYRWRLLMHPDQHLPLAQVYRFVNIGYLFNNILPAKAGEVVRGYLAGRLIAGGIGQAVSTLLIERLLDVLTVVLLLMVLIPLIELPLWVMRGGLLFGAVAVVGTVVLVVLSRLGTKGVDWVWRFVGRVPLVGHPKLKAVLQNLTEGFAVLTNLRLLPGVVVSSLLIWFGYALFNYILMAVFRLTQLPFMAAALVLCATGFSMVVPSSPGAMGVFEWAAVQALAVFGIESSVAFGYALGLHTFTNVVLILFGLVGLAREGLSYAQIHSQVIGSAPPDAHAPPTD